MRAKIIHLLLLVRNIKSGEMRYTRSQIQSSTLMWHSTFLSKIVSDVGFQIKQLTYYSILDSFTNILYLLTYLILQQNSRTCNTTTPFLQQKELRQKKIWYFPQRHLTIISKLQNLSSNPGCLGPESIFLLSSCI